MKLNGFYVGKTRKLCLQAHTHTRAPHDNVQLSRRVIDTQQIKRLQASSSCMYENKIHRRVGETRGR